MSFSAPIGDQPRPPRPQPAPADGTRRPISPLSITVGALGALIALLIAASEVWTRYLWFDQVGYSDVLLTRWGTQVVLFVLGFLAFAIPLFLILRLTHARRPVYPPVTREQEALEQFRAAVDPLRQGITWAAPLVIGAFGGLAASRAWQEVQLFLHPQDFGQADAIFGKDAGFYVFTLPLVDMVIAFAQFAVLVCAVGAVAGHFVYGGLSWGQERGLEITKAARRHLAILAMLYVLLLGASHWFHRYDLLVGQHDRFHGASYTDVHALIPAQTILAISAVIVAALFGLWIWRADWRIPAVGAGLMVLSTLVVGSALPWGIQQFQVNPNERALEQEYIQHNIDATRLAYGVDDVEEVAYSASSDAEPGALREDADTTAQIRLLDPAVVSPTFEQREANRLYWGFDDILAVDRYEIDGALQDTVIGVRELRPDKFSLDTQPWVNRHIVYTHGYGVAAAYGNRRNADGEPAFLQSGVPGQGALGEFQERVYFGKHSPEYSIVGAPEGSEPQEFDYQAGTEAEDAGTQRTNTFEGDGGPSLGGFFNRLLYAIKFRDPNIVISNYVNESSQILYDRAPQDRVNAVAPFLSLDSQMYPAVVDGSLVWVIDAYTTTDRYPYSRTLDLPRATLDSQTSQEDGGTHRAQSVNYLRNGVKATVDAYDGTVTLYAWDTEDPILKSWNEVFPGALKPASEISGDLMGHLRYPADYFKAQREILATYHVTDADEFFGQQDFWQVSPDPTAAASQRADGTSGPQLPQPPYYLSMQMPGDETPRFTLSSNYIPVQGQGGQNVMTGFLGVDSETGSESGNPADSYGKMRLLVLPTTNPVNGPSQVQAIFNAEPNVSQALNLLKSGNSEVINGNLLTMPVGGGLLYVQPVYIQSSTSGGGTQYPLLQMVLVSFGEKIGFAPTLDEALDKVFGGDSGASAGDAAVQADGVSGSADTVTGEGTVEEGAGTPAPAPTDPAAEPAPAPAAGTPQERLDTALRDAEAATAEADAAMQAGDWAAYGAAQDKLADALTRAVEANAEVQSATGGSGG
ncbi:UPF0182 family protein [Brachybacterium sp. JHP9]|uniref:UPF0182 protein Bequi_10485 n=1 Tax=Brachybacterium equifaecis TaxID=2910770 RepID=A0ABT0R1M3_9MICO|nr:UPF0182 family protein [Brachybacterium equifaecis]